MSIINNKEVYSCHGIAGSRRVGHMSFELWKMLAGLAIFMLGMNFLETALKQLSGRQFKLFLRKQTSHRLAALSGAALVTAVLQSSSIVNLLVLGFAGAGIINTCNALTLVLGANLGTTFNTWIVASLGFKLNIEAYALPVLGISGISMLLSKQNSKWYNWSLFWLGFAFLFTGLDYMKISVSSVVQSYDLSRLNNYPAIVFLFAGILITSLIQSGSATIAIVLSALYAHVFSLYAATALVLGSEVGTTIKLLIAAIGGSPIKKRVATGNFLFNIITSALIFSFLTPVNYFITGVIGLKDDLIALALFQTLINVVSVLFFYPLLGRVSKSLDKRFKEEECLTLYIHKNIQTDVDLSDLALEKEIRRFINHIIQYCQKVFEDGFLYFELDNKAFSNKVAIEQYEYIKRLHGDIYAYCISLENATHTYTAAQSRQINAAISSVRNGMYAAKSLKDAMLDIEQLRNSSHEMKFATYQKARLSCLEFCRKISAILDSDKALYFEKLVSIYKYIQGKYNESLNQIYKEPGFESLSEMEVSTIINFNHELYSFYKSMIFALNKLLLTPSELEYFDELPGFIR